MGEMWIEEKNDQRNMPQAVTVCNVECQEIYKGEFNNEKHRKHVIDQTIITRL